jgi:hypothetical protein
MAETDQIALTTAYQQVYDLIVAKRSVAGERPLPFSYGRRLKIIVDSAAAGTISITRNPIGTNPMMELEAKDQHIMDSTGDKESTIGLYAKSSTNGDKINVTLEY